MKKIITIIMGVCMIFAFAACGSDNADADDETTETSTTVQSEEVETEDGDVVEEEYLNREDMAVFIAVDYADGSGKEDVSDIMIEMYKDQTAADALQIFAELEGFPVEIDKNGNVSSINGVKGKWYCEINGEKGTDGGMSVPEDGDDVSWIMK